MLSITNIFQIEKTKRKTKKEQLLALKLNEKSPGAGRGWKRVLPSDEDDECSGGGEGCPRFVIYLPSRLTFYMSLFAFVDTQKNLREGQQVWRTT